MKTGMTGLGIVSTVAAGIFSGTWPILLFAGFIVTFLFGFYPIAASRLFVHFYPKGHDRRAELVGDAKRALENNRWTAPMWVAETFALAIFEGLGERLSINRHHRRELRIESLRKRKFRLSGPRLWTLSGTAKFDLTENREVVDFQIGSQFDSHKHRIIVPLGETLRTHIESRMITLQFVEIQDSDERRFRVLVKDYTNNSFVTFNGSLANPNHIATSIGPSPSPSIVSRAKPGVGHTHFYETRGAEDLRNRSAEYDPAAKRVTLWIMLGTTLIVAGCAVLVTLH